MTLARTLLALLTLAACNPSDDADDTDTGESTSADESSSTGDSSTGEVVPNKPQPAEGAYSECYGSVCQGQGLDCLYVGEVEAWVDGVAKLAEVHGVCAPTECSADEACPAGPDDQVPVCLPYDDVASCFLSCPTMSDAECPLGMACVEFFRNPGWFCV